VEVDEDAQGEDEEAVAAAEGGHQGLPKQATGRGSGQQTLDVWKVQQGGGGASRKDEKEAKVSAAANAFAADDDEPLENPEEPLPPVKTPAKLGEEVDDEDKNNSPGSGGRRCGVGWGRGGRGKGRQQRNWKQSGSHKEVMANSNQRRDHARRFLHPRKHSRWKALKTTCQVSVLPGKCANHETGCTGPPLTNFWAQELKAIHATWRVCSPFATGTGAWSGHDGVKRFGAGAIPGEEHWEEH
jgi:hypothetical protein